MQLPTTETFCLSKFFICVVDVFEYFLKKIMYWNYIIKVYKYF